MRNFFTSALLSHQAWSHKRLIQIFSTASSSTFFFNKAYSMANENLHQLHLRPITLVRKNINFSLRLALKNELRSTTNHIKTHHHPAVPCRCTLTLPKWKNCHVSSVYFFLFYFPLKIAKSSYSFINFPPHFSRPDPCFLDPKLSERKIAAAAKFSPKLVSTVLAGKKKEKGRLIVLVVVVVVHRHECNCH